MSYELPPTAGLSPQFSDLFANSHHQLDTQISQLLGIPLPAMTCSGTVAFILSLEVLRELQPHKHQVIVPAWTCPLVVLAIEKIGLTPVICDLAPNSLCMDLDQLKLNINHKTLAITITHYAGLVYSFHNIEVLAKDYNCYLIEDAAQALGAFNGNQSVGLQGDIGFFSLAFGKGLTSAEGGLVLSKHPDIHQKLILKAQQLPQLLSWEIKRCFELIGYHLFYRPSCLSFFYGHPLRKALNEHDEIRAVGDDFSLDDIPVHRLGTWRSHVAAKAALRLPQYWQQLHQQATQRIARLNQLSYLKVFSEIENTRSNFPFILVLVNHAELCQNILNELWQSGLGITKLFVRAITDYPHLAHLNATTPNAKQFAARSFTISNSVWVSDDKFEIILNILKKYE